MFDISTIFYSLLAVELIVLYKVDPVVDDLTSLIFAHLLDVSSDVRAGDQSLFVDTCLGFESFDERLGRQDRWLGWRRWWNIFQHRNGINAATVICCYCWRFRKNHEIRFDLKHKRFHDTIIKKLVIYSDCRIKTKFTSFH